MKYKIITREILYDEFGYPHEFTNVRKGENPNLLIKLIEDIDRNKDIQQMLVEVTR